MKNLKKIVGTSIVISCLTFLIFSFGFVFGGGIESLKGFPKVIGYYSGTSVQTFPEYEKSTSLTMQIEYQNKLYEVELTDDAIVLSDI
jgi:hypothetical protein